MAYELSKLVAVAKTKGLDLAEDAAKITVEAVMQWLEESAVESESKMDDIIPLIMAAARPTVMRELDKIDGKDDDGDGIPAAPAPSVSLAGPTPAE